MPTLTSALGGLEGCQFGRQQLFSDAFVHPIVRVGLDIRSADPENMAAGTHIIAQPPSATEGLGAGRLTQKMIA